MSFSVFPRMYYESSTRHSGQPQIIKSLVSNRTSPFHTRETGNYVKAVADIRCWVGCWITLQTSVSYVPSPACPPSYITYCRAAAGVALGVVLRVRKSMWRLWLLLYAAAVAVAVLAQLLLPPRRLASARRSSSATAVTSTITSRPRCLADQLIVCL